MKESLIGRITLLSKVQMLLSKELGSSVEVKLIDRGYDDKRYTHQVAVRHTFGDGSMLMVDDVCMLIDKHFKGTGLLTKLDADVSFGESDEQRYFPIVRLGLRIF